VICKNSQPRGFNIAKTFKEEIDVEELLDRLLEFARGNWTLMVDENRRSKLDWGAGILYLEFSGLEGIIIPSQGRDNYLFERLKTPFLSRRLLNVSKAHID
jgi:hypothetical protein